MYCLVFEQKNFPTIKSPQPKSTIVSGFIFSKKFITFVTYGLIILRSNEPLLLIAFYDLQFPTFY